jgi:hypothetical protein
MIEAEAAAKIIDEILVLFDLYGEDYRIIEDALGFIAKVRRQNSSHPITVSLANYMRETGKLKEDE